ncbi:MAG TPA: PQQ-dependent sugar dehydrogenase [Puia sp.]|nr:PQQ-dependent sugar dehydrogenase [Puia sp.]
MKDLRTWSYGFLACLFACLCLCATVPLAAQTTLTYYNQSFKIDTLYPATGTTGMTSPWEMVYGPDDSLWVTASHDYKIWKIHPGNKGARVLLDLNSNKDFTAANANPWPQGGLMGLAIHPQFYSGKPWVYVAYVYHLIGCSTCAGSTSGARCSYNTQIVRYSYAAGKLTVMDTVVTGLDGSNDHNSGRLRISPIPESDGNYHLYYTIGDMGAGQLANICRAEFAQDTTVIEGKTLRFNTEPDLTQPSGQQWIPADNPFPSSPGASTRSAIYTFGHRNPQGLAFGSVNGGSSYLLYSVEHGDKSDDEVNILTPHTNYGWNKVAGLCDDNYTSVAGDSLYLGGQAVISETGFCDTTKTTLAGPIFSYYNWTRAQNDYVAKTYPSANMNWPTVAPTSVAFYGNGAITAWNNSLLITSLKNGLWRLQLKSDGLSVDSTVNPYDTLHYLTGYRLRNITVSPAGDTLFVSVDNSCCTLGPTGTIGNSVASPAQGFILRLVYLVPLALDSTNKVPPPPAVARQPPALIYPNPAHGHMNVTCAPGQRKPFLLQLYSISGDQVLSQESWDDQTTLNIQSCQPGIYVLRLTNGASVPVLTQKVLVE